MSSEFIMQRLDLMKLKQKIHFRYHKKEEKGLKFLKFDEQNRAKQLAAKGISTFGMILSYTEEASNSKNSGKFNNVMKQKMGCSNKVLTKITKIYRICRCNYGAYYRLTIKKKN